MTQVHLCYLDKYLLELLERIIALNEKEALTIASSFRDDKGNENSPKKVCNSIAQFLDSLMKSKFQQDEDETKVNDFVYKFTHFNDIVNG
ncbi:hypothetical protein M9Y10_015251 [Tritrichomonas musculus]|uniref:Uncharacterized protein n=1 Tax=Tritrichomonas musculus TaxID=1915356 RepID=A0ABR2L1S5_9EUKA